jgi:hypothetical protein
MMTVTNTSYNIEGFFGRGIMRQGLVFSIIISIIFCSPVLAYDWSTNPGDGSPDNPYQISTPEQMMSIGLNHNQNFILTNDIVFDPNNNPSHIFEFPVIHQFGGILNGNGYIIYNFTIVSDFFGFEVGFIRSHYGVLENIDFKNANITIGHDSFDVGVLCGISRGRIENCSVSGQITINGTSTRIGGLVGRNYFDVWNCKSSISIHTMGNDLYDVGGLCGYNEGFVENCSAHGQITVDGRCERVGGLVGANFFTVMKCNSSVSILNKSYSYDIGGLIGYNEGGIYCCEASGDIGSLEFHTNSSAGGLVGTNNEGSILGCHAVGDVFGDYKIGGLVGENSTQDIFLIVLLLVMY